MGAKWNHLRERFLIALPFIGVTVLVAVCASLYYLGYIQELGTPDGVRRQSLLYTLGSAILSGGVFAAVLKCVQFLGVFERALENIVLGNKAWLKSLSENRLKALWTDTTAAIVVKGFPELSASLTKDVLDQMVPKLEKYYYSSISRRIELRSYDEATDTLQTFEEYRLVINAHADEEIDYSFSFFCFLSEDKSEGQTASITHLNIDGVDHLDKVEIKPSSSQQGLYSHEVGYKIKLTGRSQYSVVRHMKRQTIVSKDPVVHMVTMRFASSMQVYVDNRCAEALGIRVLPVGLAKHAYKQSTESDTMTLIDVNQLMFPGDGLVIVYERR